MKSRNLIIACSIILGMITSCDRFQKKEDDSPGSSSNNPPTTNAPGNPQNQPKKHTLQMPSAGTMGLLQTTQVPAGTYKLTAIVCEFDQTTYKIHSVFTQRLLKSGDFDDHDEFGEQTDWGNLNLEEKKFYITNEMNIPLTFESKDSNLVFSEKRYYWNQVRSDGGKQWQATGVKSPDGPKFHKLYDPNFFKNGIFQDPSNATQLYSDEKSSAAAILQESAGKIQLYFTVLHDDQTRVAKLTYVKE